MTSRHTRAAPISMIPSGKSSIQRPSINAVPPTNYIYMKYAKLEFHKVPARPIAVGPHEVNVEVIRLDPAIDAIVPANPKIFKLAEGFQFTEGPIWVAPGYLLFSDPNANTIYKYTAADAKLSVFKTRSEEHTS